MRARGRAQRPGLASALGGRPCTALGLPVHRMPTRRRPRRHEAARPVLPQAMLFVRGENAGISHNPLESTTSDDMQLSVLAFDACH